MCIYICMYPSYFPPSISCAFMGCHFCCDGIHPWSTMKFFFKKKSMLIFQNCVKRAWSVTRSILIWMWKPSPRRNYWKPLDDILLKCQYVRPMSRWNFTISYVGCGPSVRNSIMCRRRLLMGLQASLMAASPHLMCHPRFCNRHHQLPLQQVWKHLRQLHPHRPVHPSRLPHLPRQLNPLLPLPLVWRKRKRRHKRRLKRKSRYKCHLRALPLLPCLFQQVHPHPHDSHNDPNSRLHVCRATKYVVPFPIVNSAPWTMLLWTCPSKVSRSEFFWAQESICKNWLVNSSHMAWTDIQHVGAKINLQKACRWLGTTQILHVLMVLLSSRYWSLLYPVFGGLPREETRCLRPGFSERQREHFALDVSQPLDSAF